LKTQLTAKYQPPPKITNFSHLINEYINSNSHEYVLDLKKGTNAYDKAQDYFKNITGLSSVPYRASVPFNIMEEDEASITALIFVIAIIFFCYCSFFP